MSQQMVSLMFTGLFHEMKIFIELLNIAGIGLVSSIKIMAVRNFTENKVYFMEHILEVSGCVL